MSRLAAHVGNSKRGLKKEEQVRRGRRRLAGSLIYRPYRAVGVLVLFSQGVALG
jgi:hypothetical protein